MEFDVTKTKYLDNDILEILEEFSIKARERNINIKLVTERGEIENPVSYMDVFK